MKYRSDGTLKRQKHESMQIKTEDGEKPDKLDDKKDWDEVFVV